MTKAKPNRKAKAAAGADPGMLSEIRETLGSMQNTIEGQDKRIAELTEEGKQREHELTRLRETGGLTPPKPVEQPQLERKAVEKYLRAPPEEGVFYTTTPYYFQQIYDGAPVWDPDQRRHNSQEALWVEPTMWHGAGIDVKHPESGKLLFPRGVGRWNLNVHPLIVAGIYDRAEALARIRGDRDFKVLHKIMDEEYYKNLIGTYYEATWMTRKIMNRFKGQDGNDRPSDAWKGGAAVADEEPGEGLPEAPTFNELPPGTQDPSLVGAPPAG